MSTQQDLNEATGGGSALYGELYSNEINAIVDEIMPNAIKLAAATGQNPLNTLVQLVLALGRKDPAYVIETLGHKYLWDHRQEVQWNISPPIP